MEKKELQQALATLQKDAKKRKFPQSLDLILTFKGLDMKKTENQIEFFQSLPHLSGKKVKVCAFVGPETQAEAEKSCDKAISEKEFAVLAKDKKKVKKLARQFDYFIAQANIMAAVATHFGKVLGPKGKMPNPKAGCVFPPKANLKPLVERLQHTVKLSAKERPMMQCKVGTESLKEQELIDNAHAVIEGVIHHLPQEKNNIKNIFLKFTMSKPVKLN